MFAVCRFSHYLKCMVRDQIGETKEREELERWLQGWINLYVDADPANSSPENKARKPLAAARSTSSRMRKTRASTAHASTCARISSWKAWTSE